MQKLLNIPLTIKKFITVDSFTRNVTVLSTGTLVGQGLIILAAPILTRIYKPSDFGTFAVFVSILSILIVISSLKYNLAIPLPSEERMAINLLVIALSIVVGLTFVASVLLLLFGDSLIFLLNVPELRPYLWIIPISLFAAGIYEVLHYWAIRKQDFKSLAYTKVNQGIGTVLTQILFGLSLKGPIGLIIGNAVGWSSGSGTLSLCVWKRDKLLLKDISIKEILNLIIRYKKFPLLSSLSGVINTSGVEIVPILFASLYGSKTVGLFALTQRIIGIPIKLIGSSVAQVYTSEIARLASINPCSLESFFLKKAKLLLFIGGIPILIIGQICPYIFSYIFGSEWAEAGRYARYLSITFAISFVVVPLSTTLNILEKQGIQILWDIGRLILVITTIIIFSNLKCSAITMIKAYSFAMSFAYIVLFLTLLIVVKHKGSIV